MMQKYFFLHVALQFSQNHCDKTIFIKIHERVGNDFALNNNDNEKFTVYHFPYTLKIKVLSSYSYVEH